jgi:PadR family transcriptional regulator PadR
VLEHCVLALLDRRDCYGYEISEAIAKRIELSDGTVYPILRKLKSDGLVTTYLQEESGGPPRKYYRLTATGAAQYRQDKTEWLQFIEAVRAMMEGNEHDQT